MEVLVKGFCESNEDANDTLANCNGQCSSDSGWCSYDPETNCWDNGD